MNPNRKKLPRPRIQRAFMGWFSQNRTRFTVPVRLIKITAEEIVLTFPQHPDCLSAGLSRQSLNVSVDYEGICWDLLISLDSYPTLLPGMGYRCDSHVDIAKIWPTRDAVWQDMLFEPFLEWVNKRLANSSCVSLHGRPGESTWARLSHMDNQSPDPTSLWHILPFQ